MLPRSAFAPRKKNSGRPAWKVARSYAQWLRGRPCAVAKLGGCAGDMEAAHTPDPMSKAMGSKAADYNEIPLCHHHHDIQTRKGWRSEEHTSELQSLMRISYAVFCLKKKR